MVFHKYPMDKQMCPLNLGSCKYIPQDTPVTFNLCYYSPIAPYFVADNNVWMHVMCLCSCIDSVEGTLRYMSNNLQKSIMLVFNLQIWMNFRLTRHMFYADAILNCLVTLTHT